jgi:hypothetical protein
MKYRLIKKKGSVLVLVGMMSCGTVIAGTNTANGYQPLGIDPSIDSNTAFDRGDSVYAQKGIHAGSFTILPKLDFKNEYISNIYYRDKSLGPLTDSYIAHFRPGVNIDSNWNRHSLNFMLDTDLALYSAQGSDNNYNNVMTKVAGRVDVLRDSHFDTSFGYNYLTEQRGSPDQISALTPTIYSTKVIDGFYSHTFNRVTLKTGVNATRWDYDDVLTGAGTVLQMSTRNHWLYTPEIRVGYLIQPQYEAYVKVQYIDASYDTLTLTNGSGTAYNRSSTGYNALGGLAFDVTRIITGDASLGYISRTYTDYRLPQVSGVNGFVNLKWRPTPLTTVIGTVYRTINETTQAGVAGVFQTGVALNAEHELLRNVILHAGANYSNMDYKGYQTSNTQNYNRNDNLYGGTVGAKYLFNRYLSTDLSYTYQNRSSNYVNSGYEVNQVMLNFRGQY